MPKLLTVILLFLVVATPPALSQSTQKTAEDDKVLWAIATGAIGLTLGFAGNLLGAGANKKILDEVVKVINPSLEKINEQLEDFRARDDKFADAINNINMTMMSLQNTQNNDRILFKQELTGLGDRLDTKIAGLNASANQHNQSIFQLQQELSSLKIAIAKLIKD